jgi:hypothetical protein
LSLFEQNIESLLKINPELGVKIFSIKENKKYEVFVDEKDNIDINIIDKEKFVPFYESNPVKEIEAQINSIEENYSRYPLMFFYGIGNGVLVKALLQNQLHTRIVIVEPEIEILYIVLNLIDFTKELEDKRVVILHSGQISFAIANDIFSQQDIKIYAKTYYFHINLKYYEHYYMNDIKRVNSIFLKSIEHIVRALGNDSTDALIGLEHHIANIKKMVETPTLNELISKAKTSEVAIIASTGPSLHKQLPLLKEIQDSVTILSVDASFPILIEHGIKPDVVFSIERVIETAAFYDKVDEKDFEDIIFAVTSISHPYLFKSIKGGVLQISQRPFGYTKYFALKEYEFLGIGMSAANMAFELAFHAEFKNIILIGQDLSYGKDGSSHADGHLYGSKGVDEDKTYDIVAYGGKGTVKTTLIWNLFKNFFENDIFYAQRKGIKTYNCTEGGARIEGAIETPFSKAIDMMVDRKYKKPLMRLNSPDTKTVEKLQRYCNRKIDNMQNYASQKTKEVKQLFLKVAKICEKLDEVDAYNNLLDVDYDELSDTMNAIERVKSYFNNDEFTDIFIDATQALIVHQEMDLAKIQVRNVNSDDDKRIKMLDWIYAHRYWLFTLAGLMDAVLTAITRRGKDSHLANKVRNIKDYAVSGYFRDLDDENKEFEIEIEIDNKLVKKVKTINNSFRFLIPSRYFDNMPHVITAREQESKMMLLNTPQQEILLEEYKESVEKIENSGIDFSNIRYGISAKDCIIRGYFKDYINKNEYEIEVFIDGKKTDTLKTKEGLFELPLPHEMFDDNLHTVNAVEKRSGIKLSRKDIEITLSSDEQNKASFINSLYQPFDESLRETYGKNAIGFLATKENLEDEEFVSFIKEIQQNFKSVKLKAFYFHDDIDKTKLADLEYIKTTNFIQIIANIEIFVWHYKNIKLTKILYMLRCKYKNITPVYFNNNLDKTLHDIDNLIYKKVFEKLYLFDFTKEEIIQADNSTIKLVQNRFYRKYLNKEIDLNITYKQFIFDTITMALKSNQFKKELFLFDNKDVISRNGRSICSYI